MREQTRLKSSLEEALERIESERERAEKYREYSSILVLKLKFIRNVRVEGTIV